MYGIDVCKQGDPNAKRATAKEKNGQTLEVFRDSRNSFEETAKGARGRTRGRSQHPQGRSISKELYSDLSRSGVAGADVQETQANEASEDHVSTRANKVKPTQRARTQKKRRGRGRPSKFSDAVARKICKAVAQGMSREGAAHLAGIDSTTLFEWARKYPHFSLDLQRADAAFERTAVANIRPHYPVMPEIALCVFNGMV